MFDASYLVLGLGDVYLGAPVATPIDPRHRLVTTKYNPARTWTPENAVGIGGAYMCIYGMEGPGGYQLFGRTIQVWNTWRQTPEFAKGKPWLLNFFDQIRFFPVSHDELTEARAAFPHGGYPVRIEETEFSYAAYEKELQTNAVSINRFKATQQAAFDAERQRWKDAGLDSFVSDESAGESLDGDIPAGCFGVASSVPGNIWKLTGRAGRDHCCRTDGRHHRIHEDGNQRHRPRRRTCPRSACQARSKCQSRRYHRRSGELLTCCRQFSISQAFAPPINPA